MRPPRLRRPLKFLPEMQFDNAVALERLEREARAVSVLDHPNICTVHDIDEREGGLKPRPGGRGDTSG